MIAIEKGNIDIVKFLVEECRVNVKLQNNEGNTALVFAIVKNDNISIIELLAKNGADVNIRNKEGESIYDITTKLPRLSFEEKMNILKILKKYGLDLRKILEVRNDEERKILYEELNSRKRKADVLDGKRISKSLSKNIKKKSTRKLSRKKKSTRKLSRKKK